MNTKNMTSLVAGAGMLLAASPVLATTVDNITFPTNSGQHVFAGTVTENVVTKTGSELTGDGTINTIDGGPLSDACASGSCSLTYKFGGYTLENMTDTQAQFSGGHVNFYANGNMDDPFLTTTADLEENSKYTLEGTLHNSGQAAQNTAVGLLSVTGGSAASIFDNDTYDNGDGGKSDLLFNTSLSPSGDMTFSGSADAHYTKPGGAAVPEPGDLAILAFGLGLVGFGATLRRRKNV